MLLRVYQLTSVLNSLIAQHRRHRAVLISPRTFYMSDHLHALQIRDGGYCLSLSCAQYQCYCTTKFCDTIKPSGQWISSVLEGYMKAGIFLILPSWPPCFPKWPRETAAVPKTFPLAKWSSRIKYLSWIPHLDTVRRQTGTVAGQSIFLFVEDISRMTCLTDWLETASAPPSPLPSLSVLNPSMTILACQHVPAIPEVRCL